MPIGPCGRLRVSGINLDSTPDNANWMQRLRMEKDDELMRAVILAAAQALQRDSVKTTLLERLLEQALVTTWPMISKGGCADREKRLFASDWDPQPHGVDFVASRAEDPEFPTIIAELKIQNVTETMWDLYKMLAVMQENSTIRRAYLIVAATSWNGPCSELFLPDQERTWNSEELFTNWRSAWEWLLEGGAARPKRVPSVVRSTYVAGHVIDAFPGYEVRCVAVEAVRPGGWLEFEGDWPAANPQGESGR
jgi:hypothetical protein